MKKILGALLIGGAVVAGIYAARNQIKAAVLNLRDNLVARAHLVFDNPDEYEEDEDVADVQAAFEAGEKRRTMAPHLSHEMDEEGTM